MYKVYIKTDPQNRVTAINSDAFLTSTADWTQIDEGEGDRYMHSQGNYLPEPLMTMQGIYQYKLVEGEIQERTAEEIAVDIAAIPPPPPITDEKLQMTELKLTAMKPLMTELVKDKPANIVISASEFILDWVPDSYIIGDIRKDSIGHPKRCITAHNSLTNPDHTIDVASLWAPFHVTQSTYALPWVAPTGTHDMYKVGEYMIFTDEKIYKCVTDTNFSPTDYAQAWIIDGEEPVVPEEPEEPEVTYNSNGTVAGSTWVPWNSYPATLYQIGDTVTHNGILYIATTGNNYWEPGVFGWNVVPV